jgi:hypothetical protein
MGYFHFCLNRSCLLYDNSLVHFVLDISVDTQHFF